MTIREQIKLAKKAIDKKWDYEKLMYSDEMNGEKDFLNDVWDYVEESEKIGVLNFFIKYKDSL